MSKKHVRPDIYETLRNAGFQLETELNKAIQDQWNREEFIKPAAAFTKAHARLIKKLQDYHEVVSTQLNIPTKKDVANVAKLVMHTEEKVDRLSDQMEALADLAEGLKRCPPENHRTSPSTLRSRKKEVLRKLANAALKPRLSEFRESPFSLGNNKEQTANNKKPRRGRRK